MFRPVSALVGLVLTIAQASGGIVDLNTWTEESYPAVPGFGAGVWTVAPDGSSVFQSVNGQPTLFYSDFLALNSQVQGKIEVQTTGDDDFIGFALGFQPGDSSNLAADYLLVDWKQSTQFFDFGGNSTPGTTAFAGLAVSRLTGIPTADELWGHVNFSQNVDGGLTELARGNTLGSTGWADNTEYDFKFIFQSNRLQVFVDNVREIDISDSFSNGRLAFYNFSQSSVNYSAFTTDPAPPDVVPEPASLAIFGIGAIGMAGIGRRRKKKQAV